MIIKKFFFIFFLKFFINSQKIAYKFKEIEINNTNISNYDPYIFYYQKYLNNIYSKIKIGKSGQTILVAFNSKNSNIMLKDIPKLYNIDGVNSYNPSISETFKNITAKDPEKINNRGYSIINETIQLYKDNNKYIDIKDFQLELFNKFDYNNKTKSLSGEIGLINDNSELSFISQLLNKHIINSNIISFKYISDSEGYIYLGDFLYNNKYRYINMSKNNDENLFQMEMDYVYIKHNKGRVFFSDTNLLFNIEQGFILASDGYQKYINKIFFTKQIENGKCSEKIISFGIDDYTIITCNKSVELNNFPILIFEIGNNIYSLNKDDLFIKFGDIYYFLIISSPEIKNWVMGKPFIRKYELSINVDEQKIYFYNNDESDDDDNKSNILLIIFIILFVIIILGISIFIFIRTRNKKKLNSSEIDLIINS